MSVAFHVPAECSNRPSDIDYRVSNTRNILYKQGYFNMYIAMTLGWLAIKRLRVHVLAVIVVWLDVIL